MSYEVKLNMVLAMFSYTLLSAIALKVTLRYLKIVGNPEAMVSSHGQ